MSTHNLSPMQFQPPGDDEAKAALIKQMRKNFRKQDLAWLDDAGIRVESPSKIDPDHIDWDDYPDWRASRQLEEVQGIAKKVEKGKKTPKPVVLAASPGNDDNMYIVDGHHHAMAQVERKKKPVGWVVHVPTAEGPWTTLHDKQLGDTRKDDFGKTTPYDRSE